MSDRNGLRFTRTARGFTTASFTDRYGSECSIQKSSLATEDAIWLGVDEANPQVMASVAERLGVPTGGQTTGWVPFPVPEDVSFSTRMHLTRNQVAALLPALEHFVRTGELPKPIGVSRV